MIENKISKRVLTVGANWRKPKGGVAQVMANYSDLIFGFENFNCIVNSGGRNIITKILSGVTGLINFIIKLTYNRSIDIIHIHTASYNSFRRSVVFLRIAKFFNKKVILHIHGGGFREFYKTNSDKILKQLQSADAIAVLSLSWKDYFQSINANNNIYIISNIIPTPKFISTEPHVVKKLLFLGAICNEKGIFDLLDVIIDNKKKYEQKLELHIGGNGEVERMEKLIKRYGLEKIVKFHGWVSGDVKIQLLNECDYYVLPSYTEGLPLSILEALSYGKPILTTPVGGIPEVIDDSVGILFTAGNLKEIELSLNKILTNDPNLFNAAENAIRLSKRFLVSSVEQQILSMYLPLLEK